MPAVKLFYCLLIVVVLAPLFSRRVFNWLSKQLGEKSFERYRPRLFWTTVAFFSGWVIAHTAIIGLMAGGLVLSMMSFPTKKKRPQLP